MYVQDTMEAEERSKLDCGEGGNSMKISQRG